MKTLSTFVVLTLGLGAPLLVAGSPAAPLDLLTRTISTTHDEATQLNILRGMNAALKGKRNLAAPAGWPEVYRTLSQSPNGEIRQEVRVLAVIFGGEEALAEIRKVLTNTSATVDQRKQALESLVGARDAKTLPLLLAMLGEQSPLRQYALRGLASFDDAQVAPAILSAYGTLGGEEKREALAGLVMRPAWALQLLAAVDQKKIAKTDLSAPIARQLGDLKDKWIDDWLTKNWGAVRSSSADKLKEIARLKAYLKPAVIAEGDPSHGRALFSQTCALCHTIFGAGAKIGPELPGAFEDVDYLLLNIIDPNAIIGKDYQQTVIETKTGQTLVGIIGAQDSSTVTLKSLAGPATVQRSDIAKLSVLDVSLMPEGLLSALKPEDVRDLFSYLRRHGQAPILANSANVNDFFNGTDLSHWIPSSADHWKVANGVIVGSSSPDRPEFLTSDFVADDFDLTAQIMVTGTGATATINLRGESTEGAFKGSVVSMGAGGAALMEQAGAETPQAVAPTGKIELGVWTPFHLAGRSGAATFSFDQPGSVVYRHLGGSRDTRTLFGFQIAGKDAQLEIKDLHLVIVEKKAE